MFIQVFYGTPLHVESWQYQIADGGMSVAGESWEMGKWKGHDLFLGTVLAFA
jgi:hypothetical protein